MSAEASLEEMLSTRLSVDSVKIQGANRTSESLLSYVTAPVLSTGGSFSGVVDDVSVAVERLRSTGCFRGVDAYVDRSGIGGDATVQFTVTEKPLYQLRTGTSMETTGEREASIEGSFMWRNARGRADTLKASVAWLGGGGAGSFGKNPSASFDVDYNLPFALGLKSSAFARVGRSVRNHAEQSSYTLNVKDAAAGVDLPLGRFSMTSAWREVAGVDDTASPLVREEAGHSWKTALRHEFSVDTRDEAPMPTEGTFFAMTSEVTLPMLGDVSFAKGETEAQVHAPLGTSGTVLSLSSRAGLILPRRGKRVQVQDRFFLGGSNSFRAFRPRGAGPRDGQDAVGGEAFYTASAMLSKPVPQASLLWQLFNARVHAFATAGDLSDVAVVGRGLRRIVKRDGTSVVDTATGLWKDVYASMRVAVGLGLALETSIGRVEVNFCQVLRSAESDCPKAGIQVGISESFS